jgi:hypothetical protein
LQNDAPRTANKDVDMDLQSLRLDDRFGQYPLEHLDPQRTSTSVSKISFTLLLNPKLYTELLKELTPLTKIGTLLYDFNDNDAYKVQTFASSIDSNWRTNFARNDKVQTT